MRNSHGFPVVSFRLLCKQNIKNMSFKKKEKLNASFEKWWSDEGYLKFADILTPSPMKLDDAKEICRTAWMNGAYKQKDSA